MSCGGGGALGENHENRFHSDRAESDVRGAQADRNCEVGAFFPAWQEGSVGDRVGRESGFLNITFVSGVAVFVDVTLDVVRIHGVGGHADGVVDDFATLAMVLGHDEIRDHSTCLADVELFLPSIRGGKLVFAGSPAGNFLADILRDAGMVGEGPHQPFLVVAVVPHDRIAFGVAGFGVVVILPDEVGRKSGPVVGVGLSVGHRRIDPRHLVESGLAVAEEQFVERFVVADRFFKWDAILRMIGQTHAEAVGLDAAVGSALGPGSFRIDPGKKSALAITGDDMGIDSGKKLMVFGMSRLDAVEGFVVGGVRLATYGEGNSGTCQQVTLVGAVEKVASAEALPGFHHDRSDSTVFHFDSFRDAARSGDEPAAAVVSRGALTGTFDALPIHDGDFVFLDPGLVNRECGRGLERPHRILAFVGSGLAPAFVGRRFLKIPIIRIPVPLSNGPVELARNPADDLLVTYVGLSESPGGEAADSLGWFDHDDRLAHSFCLHRGGDSRGSSAIDDEIRLFRDFLGRTKTRDRENRSQKWELSRHGIKGSEEGPDNQGLAGLRSRVIEGKRARRRGTELLRIRDFL